MQLFTQSQRLGYHNCIRLLASPSDQRHKINLVPLSSSRVSEMFEEFVKNEPAFSNVRRNSEDILNKQG